MTENLSAALKHRMNFLVERQGVVAGNIANSSTPGYLAKDISFEKLVKNESRSIQMATTSSNHIKGKMIVPQHKMSEDKSHIRHDGNSVKMDVEMLKLQDIQMNHRLVSDLYNKQKSFQSMALGRQQ